MTSKFAITKRILPSLFLTILFLSAVSELISQAPNNYTFPKNT